MASLRRVTEFDYIVPVFMKGTSIEAGGEKSSAIFLA